MRRYHWLVLGLLLTVIPVPAAATMATIATTAPLQDHQESSVKSAFEAALKSAILGATAMGLTWVKLNQAVVLDDSVAVQIVATDTAPDSGPPEELPNSESGLGPEGLEPAEHRF